MKKKSNCATATYATTLEQLQHVMWLTSGSLSSTSIRSNMGWMFEYWYDIHNHEKVQKLMYITH